MTANSQSDPQVSTTFQEIRLAAWDALHSKVWGNTGYPLYCSMQDRHADLHIGVYCNALSHVEALDELLVNGDWCDDIVMESIHEHEDGSERLLRFYSTVFLLVEECHQDLIDIGDTLGSVPEPNVKPVRAFVNNVLKHRRRKSMTVVGGFHTSNHHGPYYFEDDPKCVDALPALVTSVDNFEELKGGRVVPLLMPSLVATVTGLADAIVAMSSATDAPDVRSKIEAEYGQILRSADTILPRDRA